MFLSARQVSGATTQGSRTVGKAAGFTCGPRPAALETPENLLEMQILRPYPGIPFLISPPGDSDALERLRTTVVRQGAEQKFLVVPELPVS